MKQQDRPPAEDSAQPSASLALPPSQPAPAAAAGAPPLAPDAAYAARCAQYAPLRDRANRARYRAANLSAVLLIAALTALVAGLFGRPLLLLVALVLAVGFVAAFAWQARRDAEHRRYATLWDINAEGTHRMRREWQKLPLRCPPTAEPDHLYAGDLDLLGHASLQHLLNTATTPAGQLRLQDWLLHPAAPDVIPARQAAAAELAPMLDFRDELTLFGRLSGMTASAYAHFLTWAEQGPWLAGRPTLIWLSRVLPVLALVFALLQVTGLVPYPIWLVFIAGNVFLTHVGGQHVAERIDQVADRQGTFQPYAALFAAISSQPFDAPLLRRLQGDLAAGEHDAARQMRRLGRIMHLADLRLWMFFRLLQYATLWNFHVLWLLERWQRDAGPRARVWLETLSELEALAALGALAFENPEWTFPTLAGPAETMLVARGLGHPLLLPAVRVDNDVSLGPAGTFLLVTGSNMSGKSTLLRAVGLNVVLAQAGGPVCAREMRLPPIALATSVRVQDSLEYGVSYFMAELRKLKRVLDTLRQAHTEGKRVPLFLLDEILHGTNTGERQIAARRIIRHLLAIGAIGIVSTHDLTLASAPELARASQPVHFTEMFTRTGGKPTMSFDYRLRPGVATSSNALKLMEVVGLPLDDPAS